MLEPHGARWLCFSKDTKLSDALARFSVRCGGVPGRIVAPVGYALNGDTPVERANVLMLHLLEMGEGKCQSS